MNIYDFKAKDTMGNEVSLSKYKGKVLLIVNSATGCGFTPQYEQLQALYEQYKDKGFEILDFPCNQFGNQAPGTEAEIVSFCKLNYNVSFQQFAKIEVNGENELPLYTWLKEQKGFAGFADGHPLTDIVKQVVSGMDPDYETNSNIKWNFTKFLVDKEGNVVGRFEPMASAEEIEKEILKLL